MTERDWNFGGGEVGSPASGFARGALYLGAGHWIGFALNLVLNLAIARVLGPDAFGPYALASALNGMLTILETFSMYLALLQSREESQSLYDSATAVSAALGLVGMIASLGLAAFSAQRYSMEIATFIVVLGAARMLGLLLVVPSVKLERSLHYGALASVGLVSSTVPNLCALGLSWWGMGAWSLVLRDLLLVALGWGLSALVSGYRFRFRVERAAVGQLVRLGRPLFAAQGLEALLESVDRAVLAVAFGPRVVGLYFQARQVALAGVQAVRPVFQLSFNLYARSQGDRERLARAHQLVNYCLARGAAALATTWLIFPDESIRLLLGQTWLPASSMLRWLAIFAALYPISLSSKQLLLASGEGLLAVRVRLVQALAFLPGVCAAAAAGSVAGVVAAVTAASAVGFALANHYNARVIETRLRSALVTPLLAGAATCGFALLAGGGLAAQLPWRCRPFLPPLVFGLLLLCVERRTLVSEIGFLLRTLRPIPSGSR
jgi:O-antigen/teichoic acid export membrane protein